MHDALIEFPRSLAGYPVARRVSRCSTSCGRGSSSTRSTPSPPRSSCSRCIHTFVAPRFTAASHRVQARHDAAAWPRRAGPTRRACSPKCCTSSARSRWCSACGRCRCWPRIIVAHGWDDRHALPQRHRQLHRAAVRGRDHGARLDAADRQRSPSRALRGWPRIGGGTPGAWWLVILTIGPLLGSFITEPAAMTIAALLLARQFYDLKPSPRCATRRSGCCSSTSRSAAR